MTAVADIILGAKQRADREKATSIGDPEWLAMANASLQELYGTLCSTYEDYNVRQYNITLAGGSQAGNSFTVGPGTPLPDFYQPRAFWLQIAGSPTPFVTIPRLESLQERNLYTFPNIVPIYGAIPSRWNILGNVIEILPPSVGGASYVLFYVPTLPVFVDPTQPIDQYWITINGWHEYALLDVAAKALIKEESLDTANLLLQQKEQVKQRILREAAPRDVSQPRSIVDMQRVRNVWSGWGSGGMPAPGWGWDGTGGGCW